MPRFCPNSFNELPDNPMNKAVSDLSSHTPMMQQYY